jgi:hypothetical protein
VTTSRSSSRVRAVSVVRAARSNVGRHGSSSRRPQRAGVEVLALRASKHGPDGGPAPVHPHLFRHARVRQIVRQTKSLPLAQKQAGWSRLQPAYLSIGDDEPRLLMRELTE